VQELRELEVWVGGVHASRIALFLHSMTAIIFGSPSGLHFCIVLRAVCILVLLVTAAVLFMPVCILIQFQLDKDRIASELCVQRDVDEPIRTCHGQCHLSKQLEPLQGDAQQTTLPETMVVTVLPGSPIASQEHPFLPCMERSAFSRYNAAIAEGHTGAMEQVPRG
jgi:hypothetical protein